MKRPGCRAAAENRARPANPLRAAARRRSRALAAGAALRDVQVAMTATKDPRTTRRYDHSRESLDRNAAYIVSSTDPV